MQARLSRGDWRRFLFARSTAVKLGVTAVLSLGAVILLHVDLTSNSFGFLDLRELSVLAAASTIGYVTLFAGMGSFWLSCDASSKLNRTVWFVVLLLGCAYGSQIAYYAFVYLPAVAKGLRDPRGEAMGTAVAHDERRPRATGPFVWVLVAGWALFFLTVAVFFGLRERVYHTLVPFATALLLWPFVMLAATVIYLIVCAFRFGMRRGTSPPISDLSIHS
jgi:hypothetical protein